MKILKLILLSFIVVTFCYSCKKEKVKMDEFNHKLTLNDNDTMKNNLPYTSDNVKQYYKHDADSISYVVNSLYKGIVSCNFDENNKLVSLRENDFEIQQDSKDKYYILETFNFPDEKKCKLIIYNTYGENDSKILNIQLNSYIGNKLVDQLLLDCRFTFEIGYYRTFKIEKDKTIEIIKYSIDSIEYNDAGDIIGEKKNADINKEKVEYTIDQSGKFIKN